MTMTDQSTDHLSDRALVRRTDEQLGRWFLNGFLTTLVTSEETDGAYCIMEHVLTAACNPPVHVHTVEDEAFYVLEGELELAVGGESSICGPGTYALAPRGVEHWFRVRTPEARVLVVTSGDAPQGGTHAFFEAAGSPAPLRQLPVPEAPDPGLLAALAEPRGINIVAPPPA